MSGFVFRSLSQHKATYVPEEATEVCIIQILGVHSEYRRRGIASKLMEALRDVCSSKGIKMIRVMVDQHDSQLQGLFESLEFRRGNLIDYSLALPSIRKG